MHVPAVSSVFAFVADLLCSKINLWLSLDSTFFSECLESMAQVPFLGSVDFDLLY